MSTGQGEGGGAETGGEQQQTDSQGQQEQGGGSGDPNEPQLGDAGRRALDAERTRADNAERELKAYRDAEEQRRRDALSEADRNREDAIKEAVDRAVGETKVEYDAKLKRAIVQARAAETFVDPEMVASIANVTADSTDEQIKAELDRIGKEKPYLLKKPGSGTTISQGPRGGGGGGGNGGKSDFIRDALRGDRSDD